MVRPAITTLVMVIAAAGCGRLGFDAAGAADAGADDAAAPDAAAVLPIAFAPAIPVAELESPDADDDVQLTADMLEVLFASSRDGSADIYRATRSSPSEPFSTPTVVVELTSPQTETTLALSSNGLWLVFGSARDDALIDIYLSSRSSTAAPFSAPVALTELNSPAGDHASWISDDGLELLMHSNRDGDYDIYSATRPDTSSPFSAPALVPGLSDVGAETNAVLHPDGYAVYAYNDGTVYDLYAAPQIGSGLEFGDRVRIEGASVPDRHDVDPWLSPDGCTLYFARDIPVTGPATIMVASCAD